MVSSFLIPIPLSPSCTLYVYAEPTIHFFERPVSSGPFPVSRCPLTVVRRFPRRPCWLVLPVRRRSKLVGWLVGWLD